MNEYQFRKMMEAIQDGLWYDSTAGGGASVLGGGRGEYEWMQDAVLRHIQTGVRGTPAEAWLKAWRDKKPPTYLPKEGEKPTAKQLMDMPAEMRAEYLRKAAEKAAADESYLKELDEKDNSE